MADEVGFKKHPLAIAWDKWLASNEGQHCRSLHPALARESPYLQNRLNRAFNAGADAALSKADKKLLQDIADFFDAHYDGAKDSSRVVRAMGAFIDPLGQLIEKL